MEIYRIQEGIGLYYLTFTVVEWLPIFVTKMFCRPKQVWRDATAQLKDTGHSNQKTAPEGGINW